MFNKHKKLLSSSLATSSLSGLCPPPAAVWQVLSTWEHWAGLSWPQLVNSVRRLGPQIGGSPVTGHSLRGTRVEVQAGCPSNPCRRLDTALWTSPSRAGRPGVMAGVLGTHPRPRQPSLRLTSLCSSPSSNERSSGEKESGSSTACREEGMLSGAHPGPRHSSRPPEAS